MSFGSVFTLQASLSTHQQHVIEGTARSSPCHHHHNSMSRATTAATIIPSRYRQDATVRVTIPPLGRPRMGQHNKGILPTSASNITEDDSDGDDSWRGVSPYIYEAFPEHLPRKSRLNKLRRSVSDGAAYSCSAARILRAKRLIPSSLHQPVVLEEESEEDRSISTEVETAEPQTTEIPITTTTSKNITIVNDRCTTTTTTVDQNRIVIDPSAYKRNHKRVSRGRQQVGRNHTAPILLGEIQEDDEESTTAAAMNNLSLSNPDSFSDSSTPERSPRPLRLHDKTLSSTGSGTKAITNEDQNNNEVNIHVLPNNSSTRRHSIDNIPNNKAALFNALSLSFDSLSTGSTTKRSSTGGTTASGGIHRRKSWSANHSIDSINRKSVDLPTIPEELMKHGFNTSPLSPSAITPPLHPFAQAYQRKKLWNNVD